MGFKVRRLLWFCAFQCVKIFSLGTGMAYGAIFTILWVFTPFWKENKSHWFRPSILSAIWGMDDVGRNFGFLMMSPFLGTSVFSYMYAFISQFHSSGGICIGRGCWRLTFWISAITSLTSASLGVILWLRWKGRLWLYFTIEHSPFMEQLTSDRARRSLPFQSSLGVVPLIVVILFYGVYNW